MLIDFPFMVEVAEKAPVGPYVIVMEEAKAHSLTVKCRETARKNIEADIQAFLANGGVIQEIPYGVTAQIDHDQAWRMFELSADIKDSRGLFDENV